jgi:hypothetical protein
MPNVSKQGAKKLHPHDATQNFGTFLGGPPEEIGLEVVDFSDVVGFGGQPLGQGVVTQVHTQPTHRNTHT